LSVCLAWGAEQANLTDIPINGPFQLAFDSRDQLYVHEEYAYRIRKIDLRSRTVARYAGNGKRCCFTEGFSGTKTSIYHLLTFAIAPSGNLFFGGVNAKDGAFLRMMDSGTSRIRTIGQRRRSWPPISKGIATQVDFSEPHGMAITSSGVLFVSTNESVIAVDNGSATVVAGSAARKGFSGDGGDATDAAFNHPGAIALDREGNIYVADYFNHRIRKIDAMSHVISTVAGNVSQISSGDGGKATEAGVRYPFDIATDQNDDLFLIENGAGTIRKVDSKTGVITTIAGNGHSGFSGDGGPALKAEVSPAAIALDSKGNLYMSDIGVNRIRRIEMATGIITTVVGNGLPRRKVSIE
jgi:hypothetical protein